MKNHCLEKRKMNIEYTVIPASVWLAQTTIIFTLNTIKAMWAHTNTTAQNRFIVITRCIILTRFKHITWFTRDTTIVTNIRCIRTG